ncbi:cupin domain-containing protein [Rhodovulum strictum]|uniref:Cupin domain-containing protein n=1 Tax=Rhodovulum strictum TaxID=58314 RepID=A0A844BI21_9RHOB|nr:cupin domain-containing protein [Rhodovulum strictum]MRH20702.1 cupin domain-containing protein [Rhodovulum strictum]
MTDSPRPATAPHRAFDPQRFGWDGVETRVYKAGEGPWRDVTRQVLFPPEGDLPVEWRYFEVAPGGWSTLERHDHQHAVVIVRGHGHALIEGAVRAVAMFDLIRIPAQGWHQFRADAGEALGFFCLVAAERDRPQLPTADDIAALSADPAIAAFIRP